MDLLVVESPTKARTLSKFLGPKFIILASMGHIRDLPKSGLSIDLENNFEPQYEIIPGKKKQISELKKQAKLADRIILATDPDREGEAIAYHVKEILPKKVKIVRIVFHEITSQAVDSALKNAGEINLNMVNAQQARRVLDRLVGYKLSPLLWRKVRRGLSAGRVQSVALRLIVEREREINAFIPVTYFEFFASLYKDSNKNQFTAKLVKIKGKKADVADKAEADRIEKELTSENYKIISLDKKNVNKNPLPPFITSTLQRTASNLFHFSAKRTMSIAQKLYEAGLITYHRTDSVKLSSQAIDMFREYIKQRYCENHLSEKPRQFKTKTKSAQEAHEAIRPTVLELKKELKPEEQKLFELIRLRALATQMAPAVFSRVQVNVLAGTDYLFLKISDILTFPGYLVLWGKKAGSDNPEDKVIATLVSQDKLNLAKLKKEEKQTQPPPRYTEASLIKALEDRGIGRPSTYAPTISTIQGRKYVEKNEGKFFPTPVGMTVTEFLEKHFAKIMDYDFTAKMEDMLDEIAGGNIAWQKPIDDFYKPFEKEVKKVGDKAERIEIPTEKTGKKCPKCKKGEQVIRTGRFGKFLSCSTFPECDWKAVYKQYIEGVLCPECKGKILIRQSRKGKRFYGCENYPKCKWASWHQPQPGSNLP